MTENYNYYYNYIVNVCAVTDDLRLFSGSYAYFNESLALEVLLIGVHCKKRYINV